MLLYCNRRPETAAFLEELQALENLHLNFRLVCALDTDGAEHLEETRMRGHLAGLPNPVYYFTGRPSTTTAVRAMLSGLGVGGDAMRSEDFHGY
jgi:ferredoxin-NADP reductase